jgi:hypothetical protein
MSDDYGGGLYVENSTYALVESNRFEWNYINDNEGRGMAIMADNFMSNGHLILVNNKVNKNGITDGENAEKETIYVCDIDQASITNNTIVNNAVNDTAPLRVHAEIQNTYADIHNNILFYNSGTKEIYCTESYTANLFLTINNCCVQNYDIYVQPSVTYTSSNNISTAPWFLNPSENCYHLHGSSFSQIDEGDPNASDLPIKDCDGQDRTMNGKGLTGEEPDMGMDEVPPDQ